MALVFHYPPLRSFRPNLSPNPNGLSLFDPAAKALVSDPTLQRDIEKGLGLDLGGPSTSGKGQGGKKGKGRAKKYPNLTDLRKTTNTSVNRLGKKVLNK